MNKIYFLANPIGFYPSNVFNTPPDGAVEISQDQYNELMEQSSKGYEISADEHGNPINLTRKEPSHEQMAEQEQFARMATANKQIAIIAPAVEGGYAKPEHTQLLADWQRYRYELTQVPEQTGWPEAPQWPTEPDKVI
ncbi:tail fiber assembly protein [Aeromonas salmonicida]